MKKMVALVSMMVMMASGMGAMKANAVEPKNPTAEEFKEVLTEKFRWDEYSPCQIEMVDWIYQGGYTMGVVERISRIPVTVKWSCGRTLDYSVCLYFTKEDGTAKRIDYYVASDGSYVGCNWNLAWGANKQEVAYDRFSPMIELD